MPEASNSTESASPSPTARTATWPAILGAALRLALVVVPYALGRAYVGGWWAGLGLGDWPIDYQIDDYIYLGFVAFANGTSWFMGEGAVARVLQVLGISVAAVLLWVTLNHALDVLERRARTATVAWRERIRIRIRQGFWRRLLTSAVAVPMVSLGAMAAALWLAIVLVLPVWAAERIGRNAALDLRADLRVPTKAARFPTVELTAPVRTAVPLRLLQCTTDWCVVAAGADVHLVPKAMVRHAGPARLLKAPSAPAPRRPGVSKTT